MLTLLQAWVVFIQAQKAILAATQFVIKLNKARKARSDMSHIFKRMQELESSLEPLITKSETWVLDCPATLPVDYKEVAVAQSLKCLARIKLNSARIKVHRYCAFYDIAVFTGKHCDLTAAPAKDTDSQDLQQIQPCCTTLSTTPSVHSGHSPGSTSPTVSDHPTPNSDSSGGFQQSSSLQFPFSRHDSSKICLKSALSIAEAFDLLPYPNPTGKFGDNPYCIGFTSPLITPRTMPYVTARGQGTRISKLT